MRDAALCAVVALDGARQLDAVRDAELPTKFSAS
jgi:hypothetical protein